MMRAVDMLVAESRLISNIASLALFLLVGSMVLIGVAGITGLSQIPDHPISSAIGAMMWGVLILAIVAMIGASWAVVRRRAEVVDWGVFLAVIWLIPYLGIAVYLGGVNLLNTLKERRQQAGGN